MLYQATIDLASLTGPRVVAGSMNLSSGRSAMDLVGGKSKG